MHYWKSDTTEKGTGKRNGKLGTRAIRKGAYSKLNFLKFLT